MAQIDLIGHLTHKIDVPLRQTTFLLSNSAPKIMETVLRDVHEFRKDYFEHEPKFALKQRYIQMVFDMCVLRVFLEAGTGYQMKIRFGDDLRNFNVEAIDGFVEDKELFKYSAKDAVSQNQLLKNALSPEKKDVILAYFFDPKRDGGGFNEYLMQVASQQHHFADAFRIQEDFNKQGADRSQVEIVVRKNKLVNKEFLYDSLVQIGARADLMPQI